MPKSYLTRARVGKIAYMKGFPPSSPRGCYNGEHLLIKEQRMPKDAQTTLDLIYENWAGYNKRLVDCIAPLADDKLSLQPAPGMWPLGQIIQHIISVRAGWFSGTLQEPDRSMDEYILWGQRDSPDRSVAELVRGLNDTWAFIESRLQRWTPADGAETFPDEGPDGKVYQVPRGWVIYHVLEHDIHHGSEISLILGMNGLQPLEI
jgi:uncharacterized damage-inducible protein DinB